MELPTSMPCRQNSLGLSESRGLLEPKSPASVPCKPAAVLSCTVMPVNLICKRCPPQIGLDTKRPRRPAVKIILQTGNGETPDAWGLGSSHWAQARRCHAIGIASALGFALPPSLAPAEPASVGREPRRLRGQSVRPAAKGPPGSRRQR